MALEVMAGCVRVGGRGGGEELGEVHRDGGGGRGGRGLCQCVVGGACNIGVCDDAWVVCGVRGGGQWGGEGCGGAVGDGGGADCAVSVCVTRCVSVSPSQICLW